MEGARDRPHRLDVALGLERAADGEDHPVFGGLAPPIGHIQSVGDGSHGRAHAREIRAKPVGAILADEGEAGELPQLLAAHGSIERARRRLLVGVAVQNHRNARSQRDDGRGRQVVFDNGEIDAATLQEPGDAPGLSQIAGDRGVGNRCDLDAVERLVNRRANDQGRARMSAVKNEVANAEFDRGGQPRPEMRVAQQDVGDSRLTRHHRAQKNLTDKPDPRSRSCARPLCPLR